MGSNGVALQQYFSCSRAVLGVGKVGDFMAGAENFGGVRMEQGGCPGGFFFCCCCCFFCFWGDVKDCGVKMVVEMMVGDDGLYEELWRACAGPLVDVPRRGEKVFYFPQGHMEQVTCLMTSNFASDAEFSPCVCLVWSPFRISLGWVFSFFFFGLHYILVLLMLKPSVCRFN